jgi:hypothetical protein
LKERLGSGFGIMTPEHDRLRDPHRIEDQPKGMVRVPEKKPPY